MAYVDTGAAYRKAKEEIENLPKAEPLKPGEVRTIPMGNISSDVLEFIEERRRYIEATKDICVGNF